MKSHTIANIKYEIIVTEEGFTNNHRYTFEKLFLNNIAEGSDWEFVYALHELAESVIKLDVNESMYFQPNRDNDKSKGIIVRTH
jgi:hypothetical protein